MNTIHYKKSDLLGLLSISLYVIYHTLQGFHDVYMKVFLLGGLFTSIIYIVTLKKFKKETLFLLLGLGIIIGIQFPVSYDIRMIVLFICMFVGTYIDTDDLLQWMFISKLLSFIVGTIAGWPKANTCALHGGMLILMYMCANRKKMGWAHVGIIATATLWLYMHTSSEASLVGLGIAVVLLIYYKISYNKKFFRWKLVEYVFPASLFFNLICIFTFIDKKIPIIGKWLPTQLNTVFYKVVKLIDVAMTSRITLAAASFPKFGVSLWGGNADYTILNLAEGVYYNLDSGMMWLLHGEGIILTVIFMLLNIKLMKYLKKEKEYILVIAGIVIACWAMIEDMLLIVGTNFLIALYGKALLMNWKRG